MELLAVRLFLAIPSLALNGSRQARGFQYLARNSKPSILSPALIMSCQFLLVLSTTQCFSFLCCTKAEGMHPSRMHAKLDYIPSCWHMQSGIGKVYMESLGFLKAMLFMSLWCNISCMWRLNWLHLIFGSSKDKTSFRLSGFIVFAFPPNR